MFCSVVLRISAGGQQDGQRFESRLSQKRTYIRFGTVLLVEEGVEHWFEHSNNNYMPDLSRYPPHLRTTLESAAKLQENIGLHNALRGFLSNEWFKLASMDMKKTKEISESRGNSRIQKALHILYEFTTVTWEHRNEMLHTTTENETLAVLIQSVDAGAIKHYHRKPHLLRFDDRLLCGRPLPQLLRSSSSTQRQWLRMVRQSLEAYQTDGGTQTTLTSFFARRTAGPGEVA